ncbi:MAG: SIMPL domain-containing protein [Bacteroidota bacterium]
MKKMFVLISLILAFASAQGQRANFKDQPMVETQAKVDSLVIPDRIYLSIIISESDAKGKQTVEELEAIMAARLRDMGIDLDKQLSLLDLKSNFRKYFLKKQSVQNTKAFELMVYDAKQAGQVVYELAVAGLSNMDLDRTEYSKVEELKLALRSKAILKAKKQAEALTAPLGQSVGKALFISDAKTGVERMLQGKVAGIRIRGAALQEQKYAPIPVEMEKIKVTSDVRVSFLLK